MTIALPLPGSRRSVWPGTTIAGTIDSDAHVLLTAWLRPRKGGDVDVEQARRLGATLPAKRSYADRSTLERETAADPDDVDALRRYCAAAGANVVATPWRSVVISGPVAKLAEAFGAEVSLVKSPDGRRFRQRTGELHAPAAIASIVRGLFGFEQWPRSRKLGTLHPHLTPLLARDIAARYQFPDADGTGETIGILQMRGTFKPDAFAACMREQGVTAAVPQLKRVDNAELGHRIETAKDIESAIDTQIAAALAPGARIVIYAAPDDERGVLDAIRTALFDKEYRPSILSISFGFPELLWTPAALAVLDELFAVAALLGVTVLCSSGDNGTELDYDGQPHVLAPASSVFAHACGGTDVTGPAEVTWPKTGGGYSEYFAAPSWQNGGAKSGRGVPDVAAQCRPGYAVVFEGTVFAMGGTSAVAPAWAALVARLNQRIGCRIGFFAPLLYARGSDAGLQAIVAGDNGTYHGGPGWNPCTGLGVPFGTEIERTLREERPNERSADAS